MGVGAAEWILNQVQDDVSGGRCWRRKLPFNSNATSSNVIQILNRVQDKQAIINDYHHLRLCA